MYHYTWGTVVKDSFGRKIWEFDKRTYTDEEIQRKVGARWGCCTASLPVLACPLVVYLASGSETSGCTCLQVHPLAC